MMGSRGGRYAVRCLDECVDARIPNVEAPINQTQRETHHSGERQYDAQAEPPATC